MKQLGQRTACAKQSAGLLSPTSPPKSTPNQALDPLLEAGKRAPLSRGLVTRSVEPKDSDVTSRGDSCSVLGAVALRFERLQSQSITLPALRDRKRRHSGLDVP